MLLNSIQSVIWYFDDETSDDNHNDTDDETIDDNPDEENDDRSSQHVEDLYYNPKSRKWEYSDEDN